MSKLKAAQMGACPNYENTPVKTNPISFRLFIKKTSLCKVYIHIRVGGLHLSNDKSIKLKENASMYGSKRS
jgi:hypothetical protein